MATRKPERNSNQRKAIEHTPAIQKLAKLTRPQISDAIPRSHLFQLLDEARARPITWIHGPPGAGKTTLAASYLTARNISGIWCQIDGDDADLASFFYYLGLAAASEGQNKQPAMPLLTPEYLPNIEGFTRRFFRALWTSLRDEAALVFDNYQEVLASSPFHKLMALALSEIPAGIRVIVISRAEPPPE